METLANLESFVRSAELGSFSAAARRLSLTPAAISRNVAQLERNLKVRLFLRSTRGLKLSEAGERFLATVQGGLDSIQNAIADISSHTDTPIGTLKLSVAPAFGRNYLLPWMPEFMALYPNLGFEWDFDNRAVDLIKQGFDVAIGGGIDLSPGVVARELARGTLIAVAAPSYMQTHTMPQTPQELESMDGIVIRSPQTGRIRERVMRNHLAEEIRVQLKAKVVVNDPEALCAMLSLGLGVGFVAMPHVLPLLENGSLVRLLPDWYIETGSISIYYSGQRLLPAKTRVFIDFVIAKFRLHQLAQKFSPR